MRKGNAGAALLVVIAVVFVVGLILIASGCSVVDPGHRGVAVSMGSVDPAVKPEGVVWHAPWASIHEVNVQQQTVEGSAECFSKDMQTVKVKFAIQYRIPESQVVKLYQEFKGDPFQSLVAPRVQEAVKQVTAIYPAEDLVQKRDVIRTEGLAKLKSLVGDSVTIVDLSIVNIDLSDQLEAAIEQKMVKQQESLAKKYEFEKEKQQAEITIVQAEAEAKSIQVKAEALAKSPNIIGLEIIRKWNGVAPSTLVIGSEVPAVLPVK